MFSSSCTARAGVAAAVTVPGRRSHLKSARLSATSITSARHQHARSRSESTISLTRRSPAQRRVATASALFNTPVATPAVGALVEVGGWEVAMLDPKEMVSAAELQTRAFFQPGAVDFLNSFFLYLMRGELVDTLRSKLKYTSANKFAALVVRKAEDSAPPIAGVVEVSVQRDADVAAVLGLTDYAYVACMAVDNQHRRKGAASALLAGAEAVGRRWGFQEAALHVYVNNEAAKKLYIANGWVERKTDSTLTSLLMVCAPPYNGKKQRILMSKPLALATSTPADT